MKYRNMKYRYTLLAVAVLVLIGTARSADPCKVSLHVF